MVFNNSKCLISIQNSLWLLLIMFLTVTSWIMANEKFTLHSFRWMRGVQTRHCKTKKIFYYASWNRPVIIILVKYGRESFVWIVFCKSCWFFCVHLMWHSCTFNDEEESKNHQPRAGNFLSLPPNAKKTFFDNIVGGHLDNNGTILMGS